MVFLDADAIDAFVARARAAPRRRLNLNLHRQLSDPIQRFLNAGDPGSYLRPHRHTPQRWELFTVLRGRIDILVFSDDGTVEQRRALAAGTGSLMEIPGGAWHSFVFAAPGAVALEIKPGPYVAESDKEFAPWSPCEEAALAASCAAWLVVARPGEKWIAP
jgi:cupin fold WbuC family metalloprotein